MFSTVGREIHTGYEVKLRCRKGAEAIESRLPDRYRIVYARRGFCILRNGETSQLVTAPSVICLNERDAMEIVESTDLTLDILYFDPGCFAPELTFESLNTQTGYLEDYWFFRPFLERNDSYIGASKTNQYLGSRGSELIGLADRELTRQRDEFWPCRSRSFFIELMLLVNKIYDNDEGYDRIFLGKMDDEIRDIANFIHIHYPEKITMETVTRAFHTNKTSLNEKFKSVIGLTVIQYLNHLRMQIACSFLRRTELNVGEIMERVGFIDDAHFLRMFKKYAHCTPTDYRSQNLNM